MWLTRAAGRLGAAPVPALVVALILAPAVSSRAEPAATTVELLALNGFDPVSYFLEGGPLPGSGRVELSWGGRVWRFASAADRAAFRDDPEVYAPRFDGLDAAGILDGRFVDADPLVFAAIGGRIYLFRDAGRRARFLAEPDLARQAEARWPALRGLTRTPPD